LRAGGTSERESVNRAEIKALASLSSRIAKFAVMLDVAIFHPAFRTGVLCPSKNAKHFTTPLYCGQVAIRGNCCQCGNIASCQFQFPMGAAGQIGNWKLELATMDTGNILTHRSAALGTSSTSGSRYSTSRQPTSASGSRRLARITGKSRNFFRCILLVAHPQVLVSQILSKLFSVHNTTSLNTWLINAFCAAMSAASDSFSDAFNCCEPIIS